VCCVYLLESEKSHTVMYFGAIKMCGGREKEKTPSPNEQLSRSKTNVKFWAGYLVTGKKFEQGVQ